MGDGTGISWTDATWNPVRGCSRVSEGCRNCYAELVAARFSGPGQAYEGLAKTVERDVRQFKTVGGEPTGDFRTVRRSEARWTGVVRMVPEHLADPLRWRRPRRIFVNSMSDLFHEALAPEDIASIFGVMLLAAQHTYQVLTKRAERMRAFFAKWSAQDCLEILAERYTTPGPRAWNRPPRREWFDVETWPAPWIWLGVSVENQDAADERIPDLLATPATIRFLSCEPLLGPVNLRGVGDTCADALCRKTGVNWVIAGCESGHHARPCDVAWLRSLRDQCGSAEVAFFLKQAVDVATPDGRGGFRAPISYGEGTKAKGRAGRASVLELPYLDGVQHAAFPEVRGV